MSLWWQLQMQPKRSTNDMPIAVTLAFVFQLNCVAMRDPSPGHNLMGQEFGFMLDGKNGWRWSSSG